MKPIFWLVAIVVTGVALGPPRAHAQASPRLAAAAESAWQLALLAREADGQRQRAEAERLAANRLWAAPPALEFSHRNDRWLSADGRRETEIGVAWPLWLPGQRAARLAAAEAGVAAAELAQDAGRLRMAGEVRESAWAVLALRTELAQADAALSLLGALADDVERRVQAGDLARADLLAARAERQAAAAQRMAVRQRLLAARSRWTLLTGLQDLPAEIEEPERADPPQHPELRLAAQATALARKRLEDVQASRRDAPELTLRYRQDVPGGPAAKQNSIGVGLRLPFGSVDRNAPLLAAALSELDLAQASEQRLQARLVADQAEARAAVQAAAQQANAETERAALLRERAQLIDKSYRAGQTPLPELLRVLAAAAAADAAAAGERHALGLARARLHQTLGLMP